MSLIIFLISQVLCETADLVDRALYRQFGIPFQDKMYSGYLDAEGDKKFHYVFFPSPALVLSDPELPVILWLNGGPGCSSMIGAFIEHGPIKFQPESEKLEFNPLSLNNFGHALYIESPSGVGFSKGTRSLNDIDVAKDNLAALKSFYKKFPEFAKNQLYISGESYAGIYVPHLASLVLKDKSINLVGIMVGNGCTSEYECTFESQWYPIHKYEFYSGHNLISQQTQSQIKALESTCLFKDGDACKQLYEQVQKELYGLNRFHKFNAYGKCYKNKYLPGECDEAQGVYTLLRNKEFLTAFHVDPSIVWDECTALDYKIDSRGSYYLYPELIKAGLKILIFSGDVDAQVPITGTIGWIDRLQREYKLTTLEQWRPWVIEADDNSLQNSGNVLLLDGLTFVSIRNAGHMVAVDQPFLFSIVMSHFIFDLELPRL
ncbi:hypothetical protein pb186bvf_020358 [Paramecium bursaria]